MRPAVPTGEAGEAAPATSQAASQATVSGGVTPSGDPGAAGAAKTLVGLAPARHAITSMPVRVGRVLARVPGRAARAFAGWARRPAGRLVLPGLLIAALLGAAISGGAFLVPAADDGGRAASTPGASGEPSGSAGLTPPPAGVPPEGGGPGASAAPGQPGFNSTQGNPADALTDWAAQLSTRTGVPEVALRAYGYAELVVRETTPGCQLSWTTLAAIGRVESNHGSSGGATLLDDGRALPPIYGAALDGQGDRALIADTDNGTLDNDTDYDRAVGPMQFIPSTWQTQSVDASGDGVADVHNIFDAALAAANYLCAGGRDLSTGSDWRSAILAYNAVQPYVDAVFAAANDYGLRSRGG